MTKDQGLYNKPSAAVHPGSLAAGTLPQYNTITNTNTDILMYHEQENRADGFLKGFYPR